MEEYNESSDALGQGDFAEMAGDILLSVACVWAVLLHDIHVQQMS